MSHGEEKKHVSQASWLFPTWSKTHCLMVEIWKCSLSTMGIWHQREGKVMNLWKFGTNSEVFWQKQVVTERQEGAGSEWGKQKTNETFYASNLLLFLSPDHETVKPSLNINRKDSEALISAQIEQVFPIIWQLFEVRMRCCEALWKLQDFVKNGIKDQFCRIVSLTPVFFSFNNEIITRLNGVSSKSVSDWCFWSYPFYYYWSFP